MIDECGKENSPSSDPFILSGILIAEREITTYVQRANKIKDLYFGKDLRVAFHDPYLRSGYCEGKIDYSFQQDRNKQQSFISDIKCLIEKTPCHAFAVAIPLADYRQEQNKEGRTNPLYPELPTTVYSMAIMLLMERCLDFLAYGLSTKPKVTVVFESIGPKEDIEHQLTFAQVLHLGTEWVKPDIFRKYFYPGVTFLTKEDYKKDKGSHPLELADILARDVFEWVKEQGKISPLFWDNWKAKLYRRGDGRSGRFSLKVLPLINTDIEMELANLRTSVTTFERKTENLD